MRLGTHKKQPREVRWLRVSYSSFLFQDETITAVVARVDELRAGEIPAVTGGVPTSPWVYNYFTMSASIGSAADSVDVYVGGGFNKSQHLVTILATTSKGQKKEDEILIDILEIN